MKIAFMLPVVAVAASTTYAYVCPSPQSVANSCKQLDVFPLVCYNPKLNVEACNEKQCSQPYIDNYAACQCRRGVTQFYEHSVNVEGLIRRCGGGFTNPFGNSSQYKPDRGTITFSTTSFVVAPTGTGFLTATAQPILEPTPSETPFPITTQGRHISKGAIAGIVLGLLAAALLAALLALCWRRKRVGHVAPVNTTHISHGPTRTTVQEKIEPVVVKAVPTDQAYHASSVSTASASQPR